MNYFNPYQQMFQNQNPSVPQQIQSNGLISVRNEIEARNYPIAPGNSVTFKDETAPYVYTKTMGFSQLDRPVFEKYRLIKEDASESPQAAQNEPVDISPIENTIDELKREIGAIWSEIEGLKNVNTKQSTKREKNGDN